MSTWDRQPLTVRLRGSVDEAGLRTVLTALRSLA
jgi:hypothetical protein